MARSMWEHGTMTTREQGLRDVARHPQKGHKALRALVWAAAAALLLLPWVAMQFTPEVNWTSLDFVVFGGMLLLACGSCEIALRVATGTCYLLAAGLAVLGVFLQVWANLAVGIIGNEGNPANLMFLAIPVVGVVGALISKFKAAGMVLTLSAMAVTQCLIAIAAWVWVDANILVMTVLFSLWWMTSAGLFSKASKRG